MEVQVISESSLSLITKAEIDTQIATAKAFPRDVKQCINNALALATMTQEIAESCLYALPRGNKTLEGPSVRLAEIVTSTFGNIRAGARIIANDGKTITAQGICHDLETNNSVTVEVQRRITDRNGNTFNEDMQVVTGNAACAIAYRNAVFKVIPAALTQGIYDQVKTKAKGTQADLSIRVTAALTWFRKKGVKDVQIFTLLDVKNAKEIDLDMLQTLTGYKQAITQDGASIDDIFNQEPEPTPEEKKAALKGKKKAGAQPKMDLK